MKDTYEDILHLPRPVSGKHPRMPMEDRAAQFAPFAALTGFGDAVREAAVQVDEDARNEYGDVQVDEDARNEYGDGRGSDDDKNSADLMMTKIFDNMNEPRYYNGMRKG